MTYDVIKITETMQDVCIAADLSAKKAKKVAKDEAAKNDGQVFVEWYRKSDGQRGYLNRDGSHAIIGKAW